MKAVIMAGGQGTRLKPLTCTAPKPMMTLLGRPVIDYTLDLLEENGFSEAYITLKYLGDMIKNHIISQDRKIKINFVTENEYLGTAGGVKNALQSTDEPFLVISGDALCDYRLDRIMEYHRANDCHATIVTAKVADPSEYGVVCAEHDGRIKGFIEKPSFTQAVSNNANTGIYVLGSECLDMIPNNTASDFSRDIFPQMLKGEMRVFSYPAEGYWCDIGDFDSYRRCQHDMLDGKVNIKIPVTYKNITAESDSNMKILPPCHIGQNVTAGRNVIIGPYTVIGDGCKIDDNAKVHDSIIGKENYIGKTSKLNSVITGNNCSFLKNVSAFENCVVADRVNVGSDCVLSSGVRIWPNRNVRGGLTVSENVKYTVSKSSLFDEQGIKGTGGVDMTAEKCGLIGSAAGSTSYGGKVGIACDGKPLSRAMLMSLAGGLLSVGSRVWSFDDCLMPQLYFYTSYCSLDSGIYVSSEENKISLSIFAQGGLSIPATVRREIERRITDRSFKVCDHNNCKNLADMSGVGIMYQRALLGQCRDGLEGTSVHLKSPNEKIAMILHDALSRLGGKSGGNTVITVSDNGLSLTACENGGEVLGTQTILAICCMYEAKTGHDIAIPFDAPSVIDAVAEKYSRRVYRYLSNPSSAESHTVSELAKEQLWARDALFLCFRLLGVMAASGMSLTELKDSLPKYSTVNKTAKFSSPFYELYTVFGDISPSFGTGGEGVEIRLENARAIIIPETADGSLKIISESISAETAESLCDDIMNRINEYNSGKVDPSLTKPENESNI